MSRLLIFLLALLQFAYLGFAGAPIRSVGDIWQKYALRPQEPIPPYPYDEEDVVFHNTSDNVTLAGTLTLPHSTGPFPAVILLHGSGPYDRDYTSDGHKFFLVWADHLTRQGIAVLRFDKRSAGKSTGNYDESTLENFAKDALAGIEYLKSRSEINHQQIGLVGHSEGGMTAFLAASQSDDIAFVVSMAAPCVNLEELLYMQEVLLQRVDNVPEEMIVQSQKLRHQMFAILKEEDDRKVCEQKLRDIFSQYFSSLNPSQREIVETYYGTLDQQIKSFNSSPSRYWLVYDPIITLKQVKVPIIALNGTLDLIVTPNQNLTRIAQALEEIGHRDFTILELSQLNHAFQTCQTGSLKEYEKIEETTAPIVLDIMSQWILRKMSY
jgi:dipeptidyl aminopeptidase/acylaminoacyl peptidase